MIRQPRWAIPGLFVDYLVLDPRAAAAHPDRPRASPLTVRALVGTWLASPLISDRLCALAGIPRASGLTVSQRERDLRQRKQQVLEAFDRGRLVAVEVRRVKPRLPPEEEKEAEKAPEEPIAETTFLAIQAVDEDGNVHPGARYKVVLPDGSSREGRTNENGYARIEGIPHGTCTVTFPELDGSAWSQ